MATRLRRPFMSRSRDCQRPVLSTLTGPHPGAIRPSLVQIRSVARAPGRVSLKERQMTARRSIRLLVLATALGIGAAARADVVTDWNTAALNAIRAGRPPPPIPC